MIKGYVINLNRHPERLQQFYQQAGSEHFLRMPAVDKQVLALLPAPLLFDVKKLSEVITRKVTLGEIGCTLSHIECWRKIAEDESLDDNDFVLIAEDDVRFKPSFEKQLTLVLDYMKSEDGISLLILQKLGLFNREFWSKDSDDMPLQLIQPKDHSVCNHDGSALYAIRKKHTKYLMGRLASEKPDWLADQFSCFTLLSEIRIVYPLVAFVPTNAPSDLEADRKAERNIARQNRV